jgi:hypothetical protein
MVGKLTGFGTTKPEKKLSIVYENEAKMAAT